MSHTPAFRTAIQTAIQRLAGSNLAAAAINLLGTMGYRSPKTLEAPSRPAEFLAALGLDAGKFETLPRWKAVHFLFQLTGDELPALSRGSEPATGPAYQRGAIDSFVFLAIDLDDQHWKRKELVNIARELNRGFAMPAILLFRHGGDATVAVIDRRASRRDPSLDVIDRSRFSLIKDINLADPHRAHVEILADLSFAALANRKAPSDFRILYDLWLETLSASELNNRFYGELAAWFAWASTAKQPGNDNIDLVKFPKGQGSGEGAKETALIRLLTRLMFVWFIKEKRLVPDALFDRDALAKLLKEPPAQAPAGHGYYLAVLQNLFFATLNTEMPDRRWRMDAGGQSKDYLGHHVYRHAALFADPAKALAAFETVPFLNGGLFECLDCEIAADDPRKDLAERERGRLILRIDGFSDQSERQPRLPNQLFFGGDPAVDLTGWFQKRWIGAPGLIDLFERYKFTVEENTPVEEEAALDPELLGKVFENLLASYNEDTKTTARNKSGSFYTPREVVDFMVDEALVAWLLPKLPTELDLSRPRAVGLDLDRPGELDIAQPSPSPAASAPSDDEAKLRRLLNFSSNSHDFSPAQVEALIAAIESCKAIDPAVGSGAFPLGLLQKLVHVLQVLDPGGQKWRQRNRTYYERQLREAEAIPAANERAEAIEKAEAALADFDAKFESGHYPDYTRKLFLIDRCLHGVDIQPIAVQIAKLRCFISLAVEQKVDDTGKRDNRGITPLPNLEAKFVAANALTPLHRKGTLTLVTQDLRAKQRALREANRAFFTAANGAAKRAVQKKIKTLREEIAAELQRDSTFTGDDAAKLAAWDPFDPNAFAPFFDGEWMFGLEASADEGWFDIALANPPYIRQEKIEGFRINGQPVVAKAQLRQDYATFAGTADIYVYFYERALRLLKPQGALSFITSNKWYRAGYGKGLREWLSTHARIHKIIDFGDAPVFEAIAYPTILIGSRKTAPGRPAEHELVRSLNWTPVDGEDSREEVRSFPDRFAAEAFSMPQAELAVSGWQMEPLAKRQLLARIRAGGTPLGKWCDSNMFYGIKSGAGNVFEIDGFTRQSLIDQHPSSAELIKPFVKGRDLKRWTVNKRDLWLIFTRQGINIGEYPAIRDYLEKHRSSIEPKPKNWSAAKGSWSGRKGGSYKWYEIQDNVAYWEQFEKPKIILGRFMDKPTYAFDDTGVYTNDGLYIITSVDRYTVAVLNSSVSWWFLLSMSTDLQGGFIQALIANQTEIPIPSATNDQSLVIQLLVRAIEAGAERPRLEALMNAFVYELFFAEDLHARGLRPFAAAREAGLMKLTGLEGEALARAANDWSRVLADPASKLYATLFDLQSIDAVRIIEGRG